MKHKDIYTEEFSTNQLQAEETTRAKQDQQVKHEDFCIEGLNTNRLQTEKTTHTDHLQAEETRRTKHDQQAKTEDSCTEEFDTNQLQTEEFNTNQLQTEEKMKMETKALVRGDTVFLHGRGDIPYSVVAVGDGIYLGEVRLRSPTAPNTFEAGFWWPRGLCRSLGGTT